jgi:hypothetical protein
VTVTTMIKVSATVTILARGFVLLAANARLRAEISPIAATRTISDATGPGSGS